MPQNQPPCRPSRLALDVRMWRHSGIGTYLRNLAAGLARLEAPPHLACLGPRKFAAETVSLSEKWTTCPFDRPVYSLGEQILHPRFPSDWALFHAPHYNFPLRWPRDRSLVITIHDLIHADSPNPLKRTYMRFFLRQLQNRPFEKLRVIVVSSATREALLERAPKLAGGGDVLVRCVPNAVPFLFLQTPPPSRDEIASWRHRHSLPADYLLLVGIALPHKNHAFVLRTLFSRRERKQENPPLVLCGLGEAGVARLARFAEANNSGSSVIFLPHLPENEMPFLYAGARAFLFPSLMEGFGLPVLEAQAMKTPVLAADRPAIREAGGDAALYFDPTDPESLTAALERLFNDEDLREKLVQEGYRRVQTMTWDKAALETAHIYRELETCIFDR